MQAHALIDLESQKALHTLFTPPLHAPMRYQHFLFLVHVVTVHRSPVHLSQSIIQ